MDIIKSNFGKGFVKIKININDDLWYLESILEIGDLIKSRTLRSQFLDRDGRKEKIGKKPMVLKIQLEKIDFQKYKNTLRLTGKIIEGPEDVQVGSFHTIEAKMGSIITIYKEKWKDYQISKLKKARSKTPDILIAVADSNQLTMGILKRSGVDIILELTNPYSIQQEEKLPEFYKKIASEINKHSDKAKKIILAGPGFTKEHVKKVIQEKYPNIKEKIIIDSTSSATKTGINEIIKKGTLNKVLKESEIIKETQIIQEFFVHLKKDDSLGLYGLEQIKEASKLGAVKLFLISEEKLRENEVKKLAEDVEKKGGTIEVISKTHESGEQFHRMGGLGVILRFRIF
jgi:protein pelota